MSTIAGVVGKAAAADGWDGTLHHPSSVLRLPSGEVLVADAGSHTLRLVELGGHPKSRLVQVRCLPTPSSSF